MAASYWSPVRAEVRDIQKLHLTKLSEAVALLDNSSSQTDIKSMLLTYKLKFPHIPSCF